MICLHILGSTCPEEGHRPYLRDEDIAKSWYARERAGMATFTDMITGAPRPLPCTTPSVPLCFFWATLSDSLWTLWRSEHRFWGYTHTVSLSFDVREKREPAQPSQSLVPRRLASAVFWEFIDLTSWRAQSPLLTPHASLHVSCMSLLLLLVWSVVLLSSPTWAMKGSGAGVKGFTSASGPAWSHFICFKFNFSHHDLQYC